MFNTPLPVAAGLKYVVFKGPAKARRAIWMDQMGEGSSFNVVLTTYEYILVGKAILRKYPWQYIVIDEGPSSPFAYSPSLRSSHARRDRVVPLPPCRLYGAAMRRAPPTRAGCALDIALRLE